MFARLGLIGKSPAKPDETEISQQSQGSTPIKPPKPSSSSSAANNINKSIVSSTNLTDSSPQVLYCDLNNRWEPLSQLYFNSNHANLVSRHLESSVQDIVSYYCPACITRYMQDEVNLYENKCPSCKECPVCTANLSISIKNTTEYFYQCGYCSWTSSCHQGQDKFNLEEAISSKYQAYAHAKEFKLVMDSYQTIKKKAIPLNKKRPVGQEWRVKDIDQLVESNTKKHTYDPVKESKLNSIMNTTPVQMTDIGDVSLASNVTTLEQRLKYTSYIPISREDLLPIPVRLQTKRMVRSRQDVMLGNLSIMLQPKAFPLEGDSSHKMQKGKWFVKNACAVCEVPTITIRKLPDITTLIKGNIGYLHLTVTNPRENNLKITFNQLTSEEILAKETKLKDVKNQNIIWLATSSMEQTFQISAHEDELLQNAEDLITLSKMELAPLPAISSENSNSIHTSTWSTVNLLNTTKLCIPVQKLAGTSSSNAGDSGAVYKLGFKMRVFDVTIADREFEITKEDLLFQIIFY